MLLDEKTDRSNLIEKLKRLGIGSNYGAQCIPATLYYQEKYGYECKKYFPNSMNAYKHGLAIPMYYDLSCEDVQKISTEINLNLNYA